MEVAAEFGFFGMGVRQPDRRNGETKKKISWPLRCIVECVLDG